MSSKILVLDFLLLLLLGYIVFFGASIKLRPLISLLIENLDYDDYHCS